LPRALLESLIGVPTQSLSNPNAAADGRRRLLLASLCALLAVLAAFLWQFLVVTFVYGGHWVGLFYTAEQTRVPPELADMSYRNKAGAYDGQFYRFMAHDPWMRKGYWRFMDNPRLRYRRILVPATAWLLAGGQRRFIDAAYVAGMLLWVFLGAYWLSRYALSVGRSPAWGLGFLLLPATLISIDRFTVDVALAALCVGFAWYARQDSPGRLYLILVLAPLARETGLLLLAAACLEALWRRRWRRCLLFATAALPALLWLRFVSAYLIAPGAGLHFHLVPPWLFQYPLVGIAMKMFQPVSYPLGGLLLRVAQVLDVLALAGVLLAVSIALWRIFRRRFDAETIAALMFVGLAAMVSEPGYWGDVNGYGRVISPLFLLVALPVLTGGPRWTLLPVLLVSLRLGTQFGSQALSILRGVL